jgi:putative glycosyltransferase (TIGR04372 family)
MYSLASQASSNVSFSEDEQAECESKSTKIGLLPGAWFVSIHARDSEYLNSVLAHEDWSYHDYRDCGFENFMSAARFIQGQGGKPVRIGQVVDRPLSDDERCFCIDYASEFRDELMDIYLPSANRFLLCNSSGMHTVATLFNRPVAFTNFIPLDLLPVKASDLVIPKLIRSRKENRLLTFREMRDLGMLGTSLAIPQPGLTATPSSSEFYRERGLEPLENDPEDILDLCREMLGNLSGNPPDKRLSALQKEFKDLYFAHIPERHGIGNLGAYFLSRYQHLWDIDSRVGIKA